MSAPRNDFGAALRTTLAGLFGGGVHSVHLTWGRFEEKERLPAHISAIIRSFTESGLGRVSLQMMGRELWHWHSQGLRRHLNASYYLALRRELRGSHGR
ncbi:hypothetical protein WJX81_003001 [Elliptochloris bilobata]|uniref:Uncharacterized protein n=1 Tax=Elliptochloris bilobata TaxID=381761 RepID=A0AAW1R056_9CHLO